MACLIDPQMTEGVNLCLPSQLQSIAALYQIVLLGDKRHLVKQLTRSRCAQPHPDPEANLRPLDCKTALHHHATIVLVDVLRCKRPGCCSCVDCIDAID